LSGKHLIVTLIGLPGSGKTTVGRQLARRLQVPFLDSDQILEQRLGCSIRAYFEAEGEERFRDMEEQVIEDLSQSALGVLSTGGGVVLRPENRKRLHTRTTVAYLRLLQKTSIADCGTIPSAPCCRWLTPWAGCANCLSYVIPSTWRLRIL